MMKKIMALVILVTLVAGSSAFAAETPDAREKLMTTVTTYAPEMLPDFENAWNAHDAVHLLLETEQARLMANQLAAHQLMLSDITAQLRSGALKRSEAKQLLTDYRSTMTENRNTFKAEIEALRITFDQNLENNKLMRAALKAAIDAGDDDAVVEQLVVVYENLINHVEFDQAKLEVLMNK